MTNLAGTEHRMELVRELAGVRYFNDSIASSPSRVRAAFDTLRECGVLRDGGRLLLIAGGQDKGVSFVELGREICGIVDILILTGLAGARIMESVRAAEEFGESGLVIVTCVDLAGCVKVVHEMASEGDVVLFSPGCASYDAFESYEERGRIFRGLIASLGEFEIAGQARNDVM